MLQVENSLAVLIDYGAVRMLLAIAVAEAPVLAPAVNYHAAVIVGQVFNVQGFLLLAVDIIAADNFIFVNLFGTISAYKIVL